MTLAIVGSIFFPFLIAGCSSLESRNRPAQPQDQGAHPPFWSGRLSLQVEDQPSQSFSASFELLGNSDAGELTLLSPIGSTAAQIQWTPSHATLTSGGQTQTFTSLQSLVTQANGSPLPVPALFEWLNGRPANQADWVVDLQQFATGRIRAKRAQPSTELRIILDRP